MKRIKVNWPEGIPTKQVHVGDILDFPHSYTAEVVIKKDDSCIQIARPSPKWLYDDKRIGIREYLIYKGNIVTIVPPIYHPALKEGDEFKRCSKLLKKAGIID